MKQMVEEIRSRLGKKVDKHLKKECRELIADIPTSAELLMIPRLSRNHRTHAPVTAIAPCSHRNV